MHVDAGSELAGRYRLENRIAAGGMGEVWRAQDTLLDRPVAVKLPRVDLRDDPDFAERLLAEARHSAAVVHPGIASVYDVDGDGPVPYLVMELVDGRPLSRLLADHGPLDPERARHLICQIADALDAAHAAGLVHRDVKPANLLVMADDTVKVTDFGIARAMDASTLSRTGFVVGTAQYLSPERAGGQPASAASDLYALGVVAYECLAGHRPFDGPPLEVLRAHREEPVPPLPRDVPGDLRALTLSLLEKDPARRPSARQVVTGVPGAADAGDLATQPLALVTPHDGPGRRDDDPSPDVSVLDDDAGPDASVLDDDPSPDASVLDDDPSPDVDALSRDGATRQWTRPTLAPDVEPDIRPDIRPDVVPDIGPEVGPAAMADRPARPWSAGGARTRVAAAAVASALALAIMIGGGDPDTSSPQAPGDGASGAPQTVPVSNAQLFHPGGSGQDHPDEVPLAIDGDASTAWTTQRYASPEFGELRPGVGLVFDLGEPTAVREARVLLAFPGANVRVHAGDTADPSLLDSPPVAAAPGAPAELVVTPEQEVTARYWLVWFERLPETGSRHQAGIADVAFVPA